MKSLVTQFHALQINDLARLSLIPFSKLEWVWRTHKGTQETTVPITVLPDTLELFFPIDSGRALQTVQLTHSWAQGGNDRGSSVQHAPDVLGSCITSTGSPFDAGGAGNWPIHPSINLGIRAMDVGTNVSTGESETGLRSANLK